MIPLRPTSPSDTQRVLGTHIENISPSILPHVTINAQLAPFNTNPSFRRAIQMAVVRVVREVRLTCALETVRLLISPSYIILPAVERSVTIAGMSTCELVAKGFVTEPNDDKLRKAGHFMAQKLAGSLALVTCKEPSKGNLRSPICQFLAGSASPM